MSKRKSYEQVASDIDAQIAQLRERKREALARHSEEARKGESAMRHAVGALVLDQFPGGWQTVDLGRLEGVVERNAHVFASCVADAAPVEEAARRTREWGRARRARREAQARAASNGEGAGGDGERA